MSRCIICGKTLTNPIALYCGECEFELKRVRLADEETVEDYISRVRWDLTVNVEEYEDIPKLERWIR